MIEASCHCGAVRIAVEHAPDDVTDCNCSICRRYGALWAYYLSGQVRVTGDATDVYMWGDKDLRFHRCATCGCVTHWTPVVDHPRMGVNARLMDPDVLARAHVSHFDGASMRR